MTILPETINTWKVAANDEIQMRIEKTAESAFSLRIFVRGEEVTEIPEVQWNFRLLYLEKCHLRDCDSCGCTGKFVCGNLAGQTEDFAVEIEKTGDYFLSDDPAGGQTDKTETNLTESSVSDADEDTEAILDGVITEEVTTEGLPEKQKKEAVKLIKRIDFTGEICGLLSIAAVGLILFLILRRKRNNRRNR